MILSHINFAEPLWLWGLTVIPIAWIWSLASKRLRKGNISALNKFIDKELIPHVLLSSYSKPKRSFIGYLYGLLVFFIVIALANPRWSYKDIDAYVPNASLVVLLDLSASMNATDIAPSRIMRARQYIEDLLNMSRGLKIGLIGFAGQAHLINPITDDIQTIKTYVPALDTDLTTKQGNAAHLALRMSAELLGAEPGEKKSVLLISDGNFASNDFSREIETLTSNNIQVHVVGIGTTAGAPYKNNNGVLHKEQGKIVTSKLNTEVLKEIARQGHGIYTEATHTEVGLRAILSKAEQRNEEHLVAGKVRQWEDRYYVFLIPAAIILLYLMRARVLYLISLVVLISLSSIQPVYANPIKDLFLNSEQKGQQSYRDGNFNDAAQKFKDPYRIGVALYRDGQYAQAEQEFLRVQRPEMTIAARYNAGNAQMQQQKWQAAIDSYEAVLAVEPDNFAAQHNLDIAKKMLEQNPPQQDNQDDCDCKNKDKNNQGKNDSSNDKENNSNKESKEQSDSSNAQDKQDQQRQNDKSQDTEQATEENAIQQNASDKNHEQQDLDRTASNTTQAATNEIMPLTQDEEVRIEQWLNRVDSDIKIFLKNKFYVEDMLGAQ